MKILITFNYIALNHIIQKMQLSAILKKLIKLFVLLYYRIPTINNYIFKKLHEF